MSVKLYMDVHVRRAVTEGLRLRGIDVLTAQEDGKRRLADPMLLDRAGELDRLLFTQDDDLLREAKFRQQSGIEFTGIVYAHQLNISVGECIDDLEIIAGASELSEWLNRVEYLPLK